MDDPTNLLIENGEEKALAEIDEATALLTIEGPEQTFLVTAQPILAKDGPSPTTPSKTNPVIAYLNSLTRSGRISMASQIRKISRILGYANPLDAPWSQLDMEHAEYVRRRLKEAGQAPATIRLCMCAIRGIMTKAFGLRQIGADQLERIRTVKAVRGSRLPKGRNLSAAEIAALFQVCIEEEAPSGPRNAAILAVMDGAGLRREEVATMRYGDLDLEEGSLTIIGKGDKQRWVPVELGVIAYLLDWIDYRGKHDGPMFHPVQKHGRIRRERGITPQSVYAVIRKCYTKASIPRCSPHDFRRTYATAIIENTGDITHAQALLGHDRIDTTAVYDLRGRKRLRKAVGTLHVPYYGKRELNGHAKGIAPVEDPG